MYLDVNVTVGDNPVAAIGVETSDDAASRAGHRFIIDVVQQKLREAVVLIEKQAAYGPHNIGRPPHGISPHTALLVRINDKLQRAGNLLENEDETPTGSEPRLDTWLDIANYGTIGLMLEEGQWPGVTTPAHQ